mmetsp:Transcript_21540/g.33701  ORF Transcript_21540/g.33701 Transcript_21540/m.33701 type:complete len:243 (-) Transcript_21540:552-1280(-)
MDSFVQPQFLSPNGTNLSLDLFSQPIFLFTLPSASERVIWQIQNVGRVVNQAGMQFPFFRRLCGPLRPGGAPDINKPGMIGLVNYQVSVQHLKATFASSWVSRFVCVPASTQYHDKEEVNLQIEYFLPDGATPHILSFKLHPHLGQGDCCAMKQRFSPFSTTLGVSQRQSRGKGPCFRKESQPTSVQIGPGWVNACDQYLNHSRVLSYAITSKTVLSCTENEEQGGPVQLTKSLIVNCRSLI